MIPKICQKQFDWTFEMYCCNPIIILVFLFGDVYSSALLSAN